MRFSEALEKVLSGSSMIRRAGWNGKGQHVYLEDSLSYTIQEGVFKGTRREYQPVLVLFNTAQQHQPGWLPSMGDLLANDWELVQ